MTEATADRLLLVDDNPTNLQVLLGALEQEGYELLIAQSGEEALQIAEAAQPRLVLLDINMPGLDGYETCERLKSNPQTRNAVVIFLSARGAVEDKVRGLELGAVDYIEKPFQFEEVIARVRQHLLTWHKHRSLQHENRKLKSLIEGGFRELDEEDVTVLMEEGEGDRVEFKSTLRWNLHTNKTDKKIENACLKTVAAYLNSGGGFLLVGVDDDGNPLGLDLDQFANEDKLLLHWNGLLKQYLGVHITPRVRSTILGVAGKRVLIVQTLPAADPVFFRRDNDEAFFVRTGNGTHALKPSEVLRYIEGKSASQPNSASQSTANDLNQIEQYTLGDRIGSGGMGVVYKARHAMLHRPAAIKLLDTSESNETMVERFQREVQLTSQLTHPNTITIYDYGRRANGDFYYVMEYIDGCTLFDLVNRAGPLPSGRVLHLLSQICGSLTEAHDAGLVHRDIKPSNIMVSHRGGLGDFVTVLDFGLVKPLESDQGSDLTVAGNFIGSSGFISPETVSGDSIDPRNDLYSLGATGWFLLTGQELFEGGNGLQTCLKHVRETPRRPSDVITDTVEPKLEAIVMQCLEKNPQDRPANARALLQSLAMCQADGHWTHQQAAEWWTRQVVETEAHTSNDDEDTAVEFVDKK